MVCMANQSARTARGPEASRTAAIAAEYDALQGLVWVVWGSGLLLAAITGQILACISLGGFLTLAVPPWYRRRYGIVNPTTGRNLRVSIGLLIAASVVALSFQVDRSVELPVLLSLLALAGVLCVGQMLLLRRVGLSPVHWIVYFAVAVASTGPLAGWARGEGLSTYVLAVTGAATIALGLIDHLRLARALAPVHNEG